MRIIFLDIDGVLNSSEYLQENASDIEWSILDERIFDPKTVERVNRLGDAGAKFVLSSSWRGTDGLTECLKRAGFRWEFIGETPRIGKPRGLEIHSWLIQNPDIDSFVILDDDSDMVHLKHRHIKTSYFRGGLLDEHVVRALEMLGLNK